MARPLPLLLPFLLLACQEPPPPAATPGVRAQIDPAPIEGYLDRVSVAPGEPLALHVHTQAPRYGVSVVRLGLDERPLARRLDLEGQAQIQPVKGFQQGAGWGVSTRVALPDTWPSGLYALRLFTEGAAARPDVFTVPFVLRGRKGLDHPSVVVMANTFTWQAYNAWGGGSFYKGEHPREPEDSFETLVSLARPDLAASRNSPEGHTGCAEKHLHTFLQGEGIGYDQIADLDLHEDPAALDGYRVLVLNTHAEYWTAEMYDRLEAFLGRGGSVLNLSGNVLWWKVTLRDGQLECRKDRGRHAQTGEPGGKWKDLGRPSQPVLGVGSDPRGIHTYAPYQVLAPDHWLFQGTGLRPGDLVGAAGLNRGGASGGETDKAGPLTPPGATHLAHGLNPGGGGADLVYFRTPAGGAVLSAGSISFAGSLVVDPALRILVRNFLAAYR